MPAERPRRIFSSLSPLSPSGFSVTGARTARRTSTYCTSNRTEAGPDRGAAPRIPGNRSDEGAPGRASSGTLKRARGNGLAGRRRIPTTRRGRVILRLGNHRHIKEGQSCDGEEKDAKCWHFEPPRGETSSLRG